MSSFFQKETVEEKQARLIQEAERDAATHETHIAEAEREKMTNLRRKRQEGAVRQQEW
jgi:hypothetical protein